MTTKSQQRRLNEPISGVRLSGGCGGCGLRWGSSPPHKDRALRPSRTGSEGDADPCDPSPLYLLVHRRVASLAVKAVTQRDACRVLAAGSLRVAAKCLPGAEERSLPHLGRKL